MEKEQFSWVIKPFAQLTVWELWEILRLRNSVFIVEQNCAYQDVDDFDPDCLHLYCRDENGIQAYCRVVPKGLTYDTVSIGRVITKKRRCSMGTLLMKKAISVAAEVFQTDTITIGAQVYAKGLYEKVGFQVCSQPYLEDDIPHVDMMWKAEV